MSNYDKINAAVISGDPNSVAQLVKDALNNNDDPLSIINKGLIAGMAVVGQRFKAGDMYVPEVLMAAKAMAAGVELVKPMIADGDIPTKGTIVIGTVKGDLHDIGKNLVAMMMESNGFNVINLGVDISPERFVDAVREHKPQVVGMSALLTTTMLAMRDTIEVLTEEGLRDSVKIIIGGAPVTDDFAKEIGADGFAPDAASAAELAGNLITT